jgi:hypothetical protein
MDTKQPALARITALLSQSSAAYVANPRATTDDLDQWEATNHVLLPEAYRTFLLEIGNGGMMPGAYCDFVVKPLKLSGFTPHLREPFPITRQRFAERMAQLEAEERGDDPLLFPELSIYWEDDLPPGCLLFGHYPSYDMLFLIVSGDLRGMVWCAVAGGVPEIDHQRTPFDFLGWFEDTLLDLTRAK